MKLIYKTLAIALVFIPSAAFSQMNTDSSAGNGAPTCDVTTGSKVQKIQCIHQQLQFYAAQAKSEYTKLAGSLPEVDRGALQAAHRAWANYVNKECRFSSLVMKGGQEQPVLQGHCMVEMIKARIQALQQYQSDFKK